MKKRFNDWKNERSKYFNSWTNKQKEDTFFDLDKSEDSSTNSMLINVPRKNIREIKRQNNKKRKKDSFKNKQNKLNYVIELVNVTKKYISGKNDVTNVLIDLNLSIEKGDFVILFGKSGSGKSTLLNIMSGLDRPTKGHVIVADTNLPYLSNKELTKFRRNNIGFIFQQYHLLNNISGYENVETGAILNKDKKNKNDIVSMFQEFDLLDVIDKYPSQMSGGQQQRISIMRALAKNADIIFADEPTGALDKKTSKIVMELLRKINVEQFKTIIMVSHDPDIVKYAKRKILLNKGKIILDERIAE